MQALASSSFVDPPLIPSLHEGGAAQGIDTGQSCSAVNSLQNTLLMSIRPPPPSKKKKAKPLSVMTLE
jgi:hypothetical protein